MASRPTTLESPAKRDVHSEWLRMTCSRSTGLVVTGLKRAAE
jgi:hypothetical protein